MYANAHWANDIAVVEKAQEIVQQFNEGGFIRQQIKVNHACVWEGTSKEVEGERFLVEPFIEHWQKWNSNTGWAPAAEDCNDWSDVMQALSLQLPCVTGRARSLRSAGRHRRGRRSHQ